MNCIQSFIFNGLTSSMVIVAGSCVFSPAVNVTEVGLTYFQQQ